MAEQTPAPEPALDPASAVSVGRVVAAHGLKGEVKVEPMTDFPERFRRGARLWLDGEARRVLRSRWEKTLVCLALEGIEDRDRAEALRGKLLMLPQAASLEESDRYYLHDIVGLRVVDETGSVLGELVDVLSTGANDVYVVRGERGELLLPAIEDVVQEVDVQGGRVIVRLIEGLEFQ